MKPNNLRRNLSFAVCLGLLACNKINSSTANQTSGVTTAIGNFRIIGYEPTWVAPHTIPYDKLTHLNYAFLMANNDGSLITSGMNLPRMQTIVAAAHEAGVKVLISVGGASNTQLGQAAMNAPATLIANIETFIQQYGLDGVDLDWEGPQNANEGNAYLGLVKELWADLHPAGKLVTTAVGTWFGANIPNESFDFLDAVNIMSYDKDGIDHSPYNLAESDLAYWLGKGLAKSKAVIGVPFYGYDAAGRKSYTETAYKNIVVRDPGAANKDFSNGVGYNGIPTIKRKTQLAMSSAGGIMVWQLSEDTLDGTSLLSAIYETVNPQSVTNSNIAPGGRGLIWTKNPSATANTNPRTSTGINDGNLSTSVSLSKGGGGTGVVWQGAGVVWANAKTITSVKLTNGVDDGFGNGYFQSGTRLQFSMDGLTWQDSAWTSRPAYPHNQGAWGRTYSFIGTAKTGIKGVRVVGKLGVSRSGSVREVQAFGH